MNSNLKVALIQHAFQGTRERTLDYISARVQEAAEQGASLVALQELHNTHYFCQDRMRILILSTLGRIISKI